MLVVDERDYRFEQRNAFFRRQLSQFGPGHRLLLLAGDQLQPAQLDLGLDRSGLLVEQSDIYDGGG